MKNRRIIAAVLLATTALTPLTSVLPVLFEGLWTIYQEYTTASIKGTLPDDGMDPDYNTTSVKGSYLTIVNGSRTFHIAAGFSGSGVFAT